MDRTTDHIAPPAGNAGPLINRDFALLWGGAAISYVGDFVFETTLVIWIAAAIGRGQPWAPLAVSGCLIAAALPILLVGPLAGVFVDRWDKRRTMLVMDALRAVLVASVLLATNDLPMPFVAGGRLGPFEQLGAIYAVVFLASAGAQFFNPSRTALIGDLVAEPLRPRAMGQMQTVQALGIVIGPAIAAPLYFGLGVEWALGINALSFAASFLAILTIRAPRAARSVAPGQCRHAGREFLTGLRFFAGNRVLRTMLVTVGIIMLGGGALNALDVFFVGENLHAPLGLYGYLTAVYGAGSVVGAVLASLFLARVGVVRTFWLCFLLLGVLIVVYSRLTGYAPALVVMFAVGAPNAVVNASAGPLLLHVTPRDLIGRVSAIFNPAATLVSLVSAALAGYLVSGALRGFHAVALGIVFGPVDSIFTAAGLLIILAALYARANLRGVRLAGEGPSAPAARTPAVVGEGEASTATAARE
jgi:MFS family permease